MGYVKTRMYYFGLIRQGDRSSHRIRLLFNALLLLLPRRFSIIRKISVFLTKNLIIRKMGLKFHIRGFYDLNVISEDYEEEMHNWFELNEGDIFIDAGANIGRYSLLMSKKIGSGKIYAFEPFIESLTQLHKNIKLNNINNIIALPIALWYKTKISVFFIKRISGGNSIVTPKRTIDKTFVMCMALDDIIYPLNLEKINLIKIDIEGAEKEMLAGSRKIIEKYSPDIIVESLPHNEGWVEMFLKGHGYKGLNTYRSKLGVLNQLWRK